MKSSSRQSRILQYKLSYVYEGVEHRLNMELDLQSFFGLHVHICTHWLRPRHPLPPPHSHAFGLIYEGAIGQPRQTTSLCDPLSQRKVQAYATACRPKSQQKYRNGAVCYNQQTDVGRGSRGVYLLGWERICSGGILSEPHQSDRASIYKIKVKNVNKKRMATARRLIFFGISQGIHC